MPPVSSATVRVAQLFLPEIKQLLAQKNFKDLKDLLRNLSVVELAEEWDQFTPAEQTLLFRLLHGKDAVTLFQELEADEQTHLLHSLGQAELETLIEDFDPVEAARLFHELPPRTVQLMTKLLEREQRETVAKILTYPDNTVGSWLRPQRVELQANMNAAQALNRIRAGARLRQGGGPDGYYVTDKEGRVAGYVPLRGLIAAPSRIPLSEIMTPVRLLRLDPNQDQEEAVRLFRKYRLSMAPIVDSEDRLLGYIQAEDIIPLAEEEVTEDFAKMAGTDSGEMKSRSVLGVARLRFPWLIVTCLGQILVALVINYFDFVLGKVLALASFMPFIAAMGGNVGSQTSTILVRGMALHDVDFEDRFKVFFFEVGVGVLLGVLYGVVIGFAADLLYGEAYGTTFSIVVGVSTVVSMTVATVIGVVGPMTLVRFKADPATATGPLITTATDLISTTVYFTLAFWLLI